MLPNVMQNDISVNGVNIHYYRTGQGQIPLVMAHGFSDNGLCWLETARDLAGGYDIIMPDARGHGLSQRIQRGETTDMTADLHGLIEALHLDHPIVAGHSMGAMETAQLGARFPGTARALILEDAPWRIEDPKVNLTSLRSENNPLYLWIKEIQAVSLEKACARTHSEHPTWSELTVRYWTQGKQQLDLNNFTSQDYTWGNWQDEVRAIHVRTLLLTADPAKGGIITPDAARTVASLNPLFQVVPIPDAGHHVRFENYRAYMDAFKAFLQTID